MSTEPGKEPPAQVSSAPAATTPVKPAEVEEEFPDPDSDDLDDLDDMLDDFSAVKLNKKPEDTSSTTAAPAPAPSSQEPASAPKADPAPFLPPGSESFSEEDFAKQLQAGMADLLGELDKSPEMQAQFEDIFKHISAAAENADVGPDAPAPAEKPTSPPAAASASATKATTSAPNPADAAATEASFQDTIRATMERMQSSGDQATAAATSSSDPSDDFMAEMLKALNSGAMTPDGSGAGGEDGEDFSKMLMGMMEQLTNKDILYEPMKELDDKFPEWMEKNKGKVEGEEMEKYQEQQRLVREIVGKFEEGTYKDSNPADREYIVDRMQKMQAQGSPPSDLVGDMASAQDAFAGADDQCNPQ